MKSYLRYLPGVAAGLAVVYLLVIVLLPDEGSGELHLDEFGKVPVVYHGRVKPLDTLARNSLMVISNRQSWYDETKHEHPAIEWLADVMTSSHGSEQRKVFHITDEAVRTKLSLQPQPNDSYSLTDLGREQFQALLQLARYAMQLDKQELAAIDPKLLDLARQVFFFAKFGRHDTPHRVFRIENHQVLSLLGLQPREGFRYAFAEFSGKIPELILQRLALEKRDEKEQDVFDKKVLELNRHVELYLGLAQLNADTLRVVPPTGKGQEWQAFDEARQSEEPGPGARAFESILAAYETKNTREFNKAVASYNQWLDKQMPDEVGTAGFEVFFNHFAPFYQCSVLYVLIFVLAAASWLVWRGPLNKAAFWLLILTGLVHSWAILARMAIQGRPPVTNLYSSAVFVGCLAVILGIVLEAIFKIGVGNIVASVLGFVTVLFAHHLAGSGDTMEMMQAVLDTNFWLATHVVCITIGYGATLVAGALGIVYILGGVFTRALDTPTAKTISQMIYGIVCFAMLFSFTGTVLGGIWADQSWGRFWGWDPKENGALLIVIWNALILHARWGGLVKQRGLAVLAVVGNMITGWSWIGTNQLGIGLHAYGFNNTLAVALVVSWLVHLAVLAVGLVPASRWRSFTAQRQPPPPRRPERPSRRNRDTSIMAAR